MFDEDDEPPSPGGARDADEHAVKPIRATFLPERDLSCPICLEVFKDVFVTNCGHSFCYNCITEHLKSQCTCPCCSAFVSLAKIAPNFALDKVVKAAQARAKQNDHDLVLQLMADIQAGIPLETVCELLRHLNNYKDTLEVENEEVHLQMLLEFLCTSRALKEQTLADKTRHLQHLEADIQLVKARKTQLAAVQRVALTLQESRASPEEEGTPGKADPRASMCSEATVGTAEALSEVGRSGSGGGGDGESGGGEESGTAKEDKAARARRWANWTVRRWCSTSKGDTPPASSQIEQPSNGKEERDSATTDPLRPSAEVSSRSTSSELLAMDSRLLQSRLLQTTAVESSKDGRKRARGAGAPAAGPPPRRQRSAADLAAVGAAGPSLLAGQAAGSDRVDQDSDGGKSMLDGIIQWKKKRASDQLDDLQNCYLQMRSQADEVAKAGASAAAGPSPKAPGEQPGRRTWTGLNAFSRILAVYTQYSQLRQVAEIPLHRSSGPNVSSIVSSIEFDANEELFVTAGVSKRIRIFDFNALLTHREDAHIPRMEVCSQSKLSCLSWNKFVKTHIAASDYEGVVTIWDIRTGQSLMELEEHEKRVWSVDFSFTDCNTLVSGSDDGKVKVWDTRHQESTLNIDLKANVCCVKYNPVSGYHLAVGSADHHVHSYDLRQPSQPVCVFNGHAKAVSYVKFMSGHELASASTDSSIRLWDVRQNKLLRTMRGHTNEKNFVGLSVTREFVACGSESNEVFVYHKQVSKPMCTYLFSQGDLAQKERKDSSQFISAVCWKGNSSVMLSANSQGTIKALSLAT